MGQLAEVLGRRGDPAPVEPATVVLVPVAGVPLPSTIRRAVAEAGGGTVAVVALLQIHGSAWGFPNPGLLPTAREKDDARRTVEETIRAVERHGGHADGQITATRRGARVVTSAARRRRASVVLVERPRSGRVRAVLEGDLGAEVRRRLRPRAGTEPVVTVEVVDRDPSRQPVASHR